MEYEEKAKLCESYHLTNDLCCDGEKCIMRESKTDCDCFIVDRKKAKEELHKRILDTDFTADTDKERELLKLKIIGIIDEIL